MTNEISIVLIVNSLLLGVGLAMDAFSVSVANGLKEPKMKPARMSIIAGVYALFQFAMPVIGWFLVHTLIGIFDELEKIIPWVGFALLIFIGGKMIFETVSEIRNKDSDKENEKQADDRIKVDSEKKIGAYALIIQGIATSIDALSVGLTISDYHVVAALTASIIVAVVTFIICMLGLKLGKLVGDGLGKFAGIIGGIILIGIGIEILVKGLFF
ncbi:MAG: manganese efflux pump [Lachnospiraceae bacterium]|nr:manganese efflux pump [Lachnospiraceae bacterium]